MTCPALPPTMTGRGMTALTFDTLRVGWSATPETVTGSDATVMAGIAVPSVDLAVTVSVKFASELLGGLIVNPESCADVSVQVPSAFCTPADKIAPAGTPETVTDRTSEASVRAARISRLIAVSSAPEAGVTWGGGPSETGSTVTMSVRVRLAGCAAPSLDVAVTVSVKSSSELAAGVTLRLTRAAAVSVQVPSALWIPDDNAPPVGTPAIV